MKIYPKIAGLIVVIFLGSAVSGSELGAPQEIDGRIVNALYEATKDFKRSQKNLSCFVVEFQYVNLSEVEPGDQELIAGTDYVSVAFIPKHENSEREHLGGVTRCGYGVNYLIDKKNEIFKKWFSR